LLNQLKISEKNEKGQIIFIGGEPLLNWEAIKETVEKGGKVLIPELGLGRAQETMLVLEEAMRKNLLPNIPIYIDGMIWDINAIHTAYPDFLSGNVRSLIFQDNNPFLSDFLKRVGSPTERKEILEGGPCIIIATSGMLAGGASVEYFKQLADGPNNLIVFQCYQAVGSLGRRVQEGEKEIYTSQDSGGEKIVVKMQVETLSGLSAHSSRNELMQYVSRMNPKPKKIIINHGEKKGSEEGTVVDKIKIQGMKNDGRKRLTVESCRCAAERCRPRQSKNRQRHDAETGNHSG
jgi:predicted metal-dependent RNase